MGRLPSSKHCSENRSELRKGIGVTPSCDRPLLEGTRNRKAGDFVLVTELESKLRVPEGKL
jgi:hypothetical protein